MLKKLVGWSIISSPLTIAYSILIVGGVGDIILFTYILIGFLSLLNITFGG
jgi:hypothetical protein